MSILSASARINKFPERGVRPFDVGRDLRSVAELISEAFAHELDGRGSSALREMRWMSYFSSIIRFLHHSTGEFDDYFGGFVWVEDGKVVGNVTVQRAERNGGRWHIANVAVSKPYRGRGIARRLMDQALRYASEEGGKTIVLQVFEQNTIANNLYTNMGFEQVSGMVDLELPRLQESIQTPRIPNFYSFASKHWQPLYELANNQLGEQARWWRTIRRSDFQLTFEQWLLEQAEDAIGRNHIYRRCVQGISQRFEAAMILTAMRWRGVHKMQFWVRPDRYGQHEEGMIRWVLSTLQTYPRWPLQLTLSKDHKIGLEICQHYGFVPRRTLLTMKKEI